ncbi:Mitochondrial ribosomal death-associated protein 3 [Teratosphaeria destructans]|uniref:Small ribosomal subunit protein mS29 n=1 Tax=Teratosphaeria destructans TaxID=418781 RepID=A0A9W7W2H8_9PEZI|nr:Mitochondrial ribosomal death-associated protein 3 [Teratosphaeria destructans]
MQSPICLRCLKRSLVPIEASLPAHPAAFSTTASLSANPPKKKPAVARPTQHTGKSLRLARNTRVATSRPPAPGERKALRKRVVLSNTNALEVHGLQDLKKENSDAKSLASLQGQVLGFTNESVDALRALEGFKPTQGWSLFRRPATVVRKETIELVELLEKVAADQPRHVERRVICGDRSSGKSVLMLQTMAIAQMKGWLLLHFPEARDVTIGHTFYHPERAADGKIIYVQPQYTAQLLGNFVKANRTTLARLRLSRPHKLPVPVQSSASLDQFAELGAHDPELAWPVWKALMIELTAPSNDDHDGHRRPPILITADGVDHFMRESAYLDAEARPIHAHDLALVRDYMHFLSGDTVMPNGGMTLAATSGSTKPTVPTLDHYLEAKEAEGHVPFLQGLRDGLLNIATEAKRSGQNARDVDFGSLHEHLAANLPQSLQDQYHHLIRSIGRLHTDSTYTLDTLISTLEAYEPKTPQWNPYMAQDTRVAQVMRNAGVQKVHGLSKAEARGVMEYYALSGMVRGSVTAGLVSERWTLAGSGNIGELEKAVVRHRVL